MTSFKGNAFVHTHTCKANTQLSYSRRFYYGLLIVVASRPRKRPLYGLEISQFKRPGRLGRRVRYITVKRRDNVTNTGEIM